MRRLFPHIIAITLAAALTLASCTGAIDPSQVGTMQVSVWTGRRAVQWNASATETAAFVKAYNSATPTDEEGGTTPRVRVELFLPNEPPLEISLTSQGFHEVGSRKVKSKLLDRQFHVLLDEGQRRERQSK